ncbi:hypothetical protein Q5P01_000429 [Channa striata]|uniref:Uncharacterized protein n=1 Tax=Channa striata TaxID=64152 RepID=A0AA88IIV5_CHASR|nr:hypothetical protein Q5P01_000429 [Channa striata]
MVSVGYGPRSSAGLLRCARRVRGGDLPGRGQREGAPRGLSRPLGPAAVADKFKRAGSRCPSSWPACTDPSGGYAQEDMRDRESSVPVRAIRDPKAASRKKATRVRGQDSGLGNPVGRPRPFVKDRRVKLEYENSSSGVLPRGEEELVSLTPRPGRQRRPVFPLGQDQGTLRREEHRDRHPRRLKVSKASVKTTYVEIVRTWLQKITGLSTKPVECHEFYKCNPCEAAFYRYPLNLKLRGCTTAMFGVPWLLRAKAAFGRRAAGRGGRGRKKGVESLEATRDSAG